MHAVKFGLFLLPDDIAAAQNAAIRAEREGFFSVSVNDHFYSPLGTPHSPQLECFTALTAMAAVTSRIRLAPAVAAASFRTPPLLAKITSSLDLASAGRLIVGLGAGWQGTEYAAHGYPFPSTAERIEQMEECVQVLKAMWTQESPTFHGRYFSIENAYNNPRPVQKPYPPIMLGGSGRRLLQIAAKEADIINIIPPTSNGKDFVNDPFATVRFDMERLRQKIKILHDFARDIGRNPQEIELGGLVLLGLSSDPKDPELRDMATKLGFPDYASAQRSPVALLGTPDEVTRTLKARIADTGVTYYIMLAATEASQELFVKEIMPEFTQR